MSLCCPQVYRPFRCLLQPSSHATKIKLILVLRCFKFQTFLLLLSLKPTSLVLFVLPFWRENSSLCVPLSQMSHSTEPVTTFDLCFDGCGSPWQRHGVFNESHLHKHKPSSFSSWVFFSLEPLFHSSSLFFSFSVGRIKETFSV